MKKSVLYKIFITGLVTVLIVPVNMLIGGNNLSYAEETATVQLNAGELLSSKLNAYLSSTSYDRNVDEWLWSIQFTNVQSDVEKIGISFSENQEVSNMKGSNGVIISQKEGFFELDPGELKVEFHTKERSSVTADIYQFKDSKKIRLGTLKNTNRPAESKSTTKASENTTNVMPSSSDKLEESGKSSDSMTRDDVQKNSSTDEKINANVASESITDTTKKVDSSDTQNSVQENTRAKMNTSRASLGSPLTGNTGNPEVPKGAILLEGVFGNINSAGNKGSSGVNNIYNPNVNNGVPYSEISLSGSKNWLSIWSKDQYRMDFSNSFHGRTYINFGNAANGDADGLAFVMQNASSTALTTANSSDDGQNLGVYGGTKAWRSSIFSSWVTPETYAIKKSVAIEFDLYSNSDGRGHDYDKDNPQTPHMAYSFPSNLSKGYRPQGNGDKWEGGALSTNGADAVIRHNGFRLLNGVVGDNIRDNTWYEFRYDFDQPTHTFSYYLKNPITGAQTQPVTIPWADLSAELNLSDSNNMAYWGFTGANGAASGQVKFVFTQVPVDLSAKIENDVLNLGKSVVDIEDHDTYNPQLPAAQDSDLLTFQTRFTVSEGEAALKINEWKSYVSPVDIDLTKTVKNVIAQIGAKKYTGTATVNRETGEIKTTFSNLEVHPGEDVYMSYELNPTKHTETKKTHFSSHVTTEEVGNKTVNDFLSQQVPFWIKGNQAPILSELTTDKKEYTDYLDSFHYSFKYRDADRDKLSYAVKINGKTINDQTVLDSDISDQLFEGTLDSNINLLAANTPFVVGINTISVSINDGIHPAETMESKFILNGYLGFEELTQDYSWKYSRTELSDTKTPMSRQEKMKIKIRDTRNLKKESFIRVKMEAKSASKALLSDQFTFNNQSLGETEFPVNKELNYDKDAGLLLKLDNTSEIGTVSGKLVWTIIDAP